MQVRLPSESINLDSENKEAGSERSKESVLEIEELRTYYANHIKSKVFFQRVGDTSATYYILYLHESANEIDKFVDTFIEYFPFYVENEDLLGPLVMDVDFVDNLKQHSKRIWKKPIVPDRPIERNGVFGELYLDFYERVVNNTCLITTYASRRSYKSDAENKGFDHIGFVLGDNGEMELVLGEAKYVVNASSAKDSLLEDITGVETTAGHLSTEYLDDFMDFILGVRTPVSEREKYLIKRQFDRINAALYSGTKFTEYLINSSMKVHVVFFAIFKDSRRRPSDYRNHYDEIYNTAVCALNGMGISNYEIEIVFIPTDSTSMTIKRAIADYYE